MKTKNETFVFHDEIQRQYGKIFPKPYKEEYFDEFYDLKQMSKKENPFEFYTEFKNGNLDLSLKENTELDEEAYKIDVSNEGIVIEYSCDKSLYRAFTSLWQLICEDKVQFCSVYDKPEFKQRGYMLDISRGRIPKLEEILKIVDYISGLKYNEFQLYMENFCFKYSNFPEFTKDFDCLTPNDIKVIDKYCKDRFIELVPSQNGFGHMRTWLDRDEYKHLEVTDGEAKTDTLDITNPEAYKLIDKIYASLLPLFSSDKVHIGMDEAFGLGKFQLESVCKEKGKSKVFADWLNKISDLCEKKYNKSVLFWSDMIINYPEIFSDIPKSAIPCIWDYEDMAMHLTENKCRMLHDKNIKYYIAPATSTWLSFCGRFENAAFNIRACAEMAKEYDAEGILLTTWGDGGHTQFFAWELVPIALNAQYAWNTGIKQHGGWRRPYYVTEAQRYADKYVFKAEVSKYLCRMANYYQLEPERIHGGTICHWILQTPLEKMIKPDFFDFEKIGSHFDFCELKKYVSALIDIISNMDFEDRFKREIILDGRLVILACEYAFVKIDKAVSEEKAEEITKLSKSLIKEYDELWHLTCFDNGIDTSIGYIKDRQKELTKFIK